MKKLLPLLLLIIMLFPVVSYSQTPMSGYYYESFESPPFPPNGWTRLNVGGNEEWVRSANEANTGTYSAFIDYEAPSGVDWLISPQFIVTSGDSLVFWMMPQFEDDFADELSVRVSTSGNSPADFTTELLNLTNGVNYPTDWTRYVLSLDNAFSGDSIYIAFRHTNQNGVGVYIDDVEIGNRPDAEVGITAINIDEHISTPFNPEVTLINYGDQPQTFTITLTDGAGYISTQAVSNLGASQQRQVSFATWSAPVGSYTFTATATVPGDANTGNNTIVQTGEAFLPLQTYGWEAKDSLPEARYGHGTVSKETSGELYTFTGINEVNDFAAVNYLYQSSDWQPPQTLQDIPTPRWQISTQVINDKVYIPGGITNAGITNELSIYDISTDAWSSVGMFTTPTDPYHVTDYATAVVDGRLYIIGGFNGTTKLNTIFVYDPTNNTLDRADDTLDVSLSGISAASYGNEILAVGGEDNSGNLSDDVYLITVSPTDPLDLQVDLLSEGYPEGPIARLAAGSTAESPDTLYFTGGYTDPSGEIVSNGLWGYDLNNNQWLIGQEKPTPVSDVSNFVPIEVDGISYLAVAGGYDGFEASSANEWVRLTPITPLPVSFLSASASYHSDTVTVNWATASEKDNDYFTIERSVDGSTFSSIGTVKGKGNSQTILHYLFHDTDPLGGTSYYRIKQTDFDGSFSYSKVVTVTADELPALRVTVAPNPALAENANIKLVVREQQDVKIRVYDVAGKLHVAKQMNISAGNTVLPLRLNRGYYLIQIQTAEKTILEKLIVN